MAEFTLEEINLDDLLFILGGTIFQGSTTDDIEIELLVRLQELLKLKIEERNNGMPSGTILH